VLHITLQHPVRMKHMQETKRPRPVGSISTLARGVMELQGQAATQIQEQQ
jgi:hypothetical protein